MKRSKAEQIYSILQILYSSPCKLTHLMYKSNVNCLILKGMLNLLQSQGYVEIQKRSLSQHKITSRYSKMFALTVKGDAFYCSVDQALKALDYLVEQWDKQRYIQQAQTLKTETETEGW